MLSSFYAAFESLPIILKFLVFFFVIVPIMVSIQIFIMPLSMIISILDVVMILVCRNCHSWEPDFLQIIAFYPIFLIYVFGENLFSRRY